MKNKNTNVFLIVMGLLILLELVVTICLFKKNIVISIISLITLSFVALYGFYLYKIPHGNLLKYAMLLLAVMIVLNATSSTKLSGFNLYIQTVKLLAVIGIAYIAGRLNRLDKNTALCFIIDLVLLASDILIIVYAGRYMDALTIIKVFSDFIMFTTLITSYLIRYKEHKEAASSIIEHN